MQVATAKDAKVATPQTWTLDTPPAACLARVALWCV